MDIHDWLLNSELPRRVQDDWQSINEASWLTFFCNYYRGLQEYWLTPSTQLILVFNEFITLSHLKQWVFCEATYTLNVFRTH